MGRPSVVIVLYVRVSTGGTGAFGCFSADRELMVLGSPGATAA